MKTKKVYLFCFFLSLLVAPIFLVEQSSALTTDDFKCSGTIYQIPAVKKVCDSGSTNTRGAMWVNSCSGGNCILDPYPTVVFNESYPGSSTLYIWGSSRYGYTSASNDATHTHLISASKLGSNKSNWESTYLERYSGLATGAFCFNGVSVQPDWFNKGCDLSSGVTVSRPGTGNSTWGWPTSPVTITLNSSELQSLSNEINTYGSSCGTYCKRVQYYDYRCFSNNTSGGCSASDQTIEFNTVGAHKTASAATFNHDSNYVTTGLRSGNVSGTTNTATYNYSGVVMSGESVSIDFTHQIQKLGITENSNYNIFLGSSDGTSSLESVVGAPSISGDVYGSGVQYVYNFTAPTVTTETSYSLCETITNSYSTYGISGDTVSTRACVVIRVRPTSSANIYTLSNSSARDDLSNAWETTDACLGSSCPRASDSKTTCVGTDVRVIFSHNVYTSPDQINNPVNWQVSRFVRKGTNYNTATQTSDFNGTSDYTVTAGSDAGTGQNGTSGTISGSVKLTYPEYDIDLATGGQISGYAAENLNTAYYTDGGTNYFLHRDVYNVRFSQTGTYHFCETLSSGGSTSTACVEIIVQNCGTPESISCPVTFNHTTGDDQHNGTTSAVSAVKNISVSGYSNWSKTETEPIYAKPGDDLAFAHCYWPGAAMVKKSSGSHEEPKPTSPCDSWSPSCSLTSYSVVGSQDTYVDTNQKDTSHFNFSLTTSNGSVVGATPSFSVEQLHSAYSISSNTVTGTNGQLDLGVFKTNNSLVVRRQKAGETISQYVSSNYMGTNSSGPSHNSWSWTWTYTYHYMGSCPTADGGSEPCEQTGTGYGSGSGSHDKTWYAGTKGTSSGTSNYARVYIPYNYTTAIATVVGNSSSGIVYAGESVSAQANLAIRTRYNSITEGTYATETPNTEVRMISFVLPYSTNLNNSARFGTVTTGMNATNVNAGTSYDPCSYFANHFSGVTYCETRDSNTNSWNSSGNSGEWSGTAIPQQNISVPDVEDGSLFCVASAIKSANSGNDTNGNGTRTVNTNWNISPMVCRTVAKKPKFQILGGSSFINGQINASISNKRRTGTSLSNSAAFTSLDEFAITSTNSIILNTSKGMSSGNHDSIGGSISNSGAICTLSPLSIANNRCGTSSQTGVSNVNMNASILDALLSRFSIDSSYDNVARDNSNINLANGYTKSEDVHTDPSDPHYYLHGYRYTYASGDIRIATAPEEVYGVTHIIYSENGDIFIDTNMKYNNCPDQYYENASTHAITRYCGYTEPGDVPQYIVIAKNGNIKIGENVTEIDAILISQGFSGGTVDTCNNHNVDNGLTSNSICNNPLVINGAVFAKKLLLKRTYGGDNEKSGSSTVSVVKDLLERRFVTSPTGSSTPAEIINFSPATALWAYSQARDYPQAFTTYIRELAPRY